MKKLNHPISDVPYRVHTSDRSVYRQCRRKWAWCSNQTGCLGLEPKTWNQHFWLGTGFHQALEFHYARGETPSTVFSAYADEWEATHKELTKNWDADEWDLYRSVRSLGYGICEHYLEFAQEQDSINELDPSSHGFEIVTTEQKFSVPIRDEDGKQLLVLILDDDGVWRYHPANYEGRFDGIIRDKYGLLWIFEHKTAKSIYETKLTNDDQVGSYIWAARWIYGFDIVGALYNVALKKTPVVPPVLKNGRFLSQSEVLLKGTTKRVYLDAIDKNGFDIADYEGTLAVLETYGWEYFFRRYWIKRSANEITEIGLRIAAEVREMTSPTMVAYPNPDALRCPFCSFRAPCLQLSDGADWKTTLKANYQKRVSTDVDVMEEYPL